MDVDGFIRELREDPDQLNTADVARRAERRRKFDRDLHKRLAKKLDPGGLSARARRHRPPKGTRKPGSSRKPTDFPGRPQAGSTPAADPPAAATPSIPTIVSGDSLAARARKMTRKGKQQSD